MTPRWTPARQRGVELLDDPSVDWTVRERAMADVARSNTLFGGTRAVTRALRRVVGTLPPRALLLDVGTGTGDIARAARDTAAAAGVELSVVGLDVSEELVRAAGSRLTAGAVADACAIPLADGSVDVCLCSQLLHHFPDDGARALLRELHRVSRGWVLVSDLQRSRLAAAGFSMASRLLGFHAVTRADGVVSVLRGFTREELSGLVHSATGVVPEIRSGMFWRLSALWATRHGAGETARSR